MPGAVLAWRARRNEAVGAAVPESPLLAGRAAGLAYVCLRGVCLAPVDNAGDLVSALEAVVTSP